MRLRWTVGAGLAAALLLTLTLERPATADPESEDPASLRIEYRPGAYMPPGFPLQGTVKLLTSPVVQAGERHRVRVE